MTPCTKQRILNDGTTFFVKESTMSNVSAASVLLSTFLICSDWLIMGKYLLILPTKKSI